MVDAPPPPQPRHSAASLSSARDDASEGRRKTKRADLTQNACARCRQKKSKCDGRRPGCGRCEKNNAVCIYEIAQEGMTRMQNLQQRLSQRDSDHTRLMTVFDALRSTSEADAAKLLAHLRTQNDFPALVALAEELRAPSSQQPDDVPSPLITQMVPPWAESPYAHGSPAYHMSDASTPSYPGDSMRGLQIPGPPLGMANVMPALHSGYGFEQRHEAQYQTPEDAYRQAHAPYFHEPQWQDGYGPGAGNPSSTTSHTTSPLQHSQPTSSGGQMDLSPYHSQPSPYDTYLGLAQRHYPGVGHSKPIYDQSQMDVDGYDEEEDEDEGDADDDDDDDDRDDR